MDDIELTKMVWYEQIKPNTSSRVEGTQVPAKPMSPVLAQKLMALPAESLGQMKPGRYSGLVIQPSSLSVSNVKLPGSLRYGSDTHISQVTQAIFAQPSSALKHNETLQAQAQESKAQEEEGVSSNPV